MKVTYIAYEFPALTQTFVFREVLSLIDLGVDVRVVALRMPEKTIAASRDVAPLVSRVDYVGYTSALKGTIDLVRLLASHPLRTATAVRLLVARVHPARKWFAYAFHLLQACSLVCREDIGTADLIHAHFAAGPSSIAMFSSVLSGVPFSVTAHAYDLFAEEVGLREKVRRAALFVTISEYNRRWLIGRFGQDAEGVELVHCGVDAPALVEFARSRAKIARRVVAVGSLGAKKGHDVLIRACSILKQRGVGLECRVIGDGPLRGELEELVGELEVGDVVTLCGGLPPEHVREEVAAATVAVLACRRAVSGDMDGIPVALMEAMAMGCVVVSTRVSGIPELITDGVSGLLVEPDSAEALADALERALGAGDDLTEMEARAVERASADFDERANARRLVTLMNAVARRGGG